MRKVYIFFYLITFIVALVACKGETAVTPVPQVPTPTLSAEAALGKTIFTRECASCHSLAENTVIVGPSLHKIALRAKERVPHQDAETYLLVSIVYPGSFLVEGYQDLMPSTFGKRLTGEEIDALITYLLTLE